MTRQQVGWYDGSRVHQLELRKPGAPVPRHLAHTADWVPVTVGDEPDTAALVAEVERLRTALRAVDAWELPAVTDRAGHPSSFQLEYGSNGARDYFRGIAHAALQYDEKPPLPPSLQAEAQAVGAGVDPESLEAGDPA